MKVCIREMVFLFYLLVAWKKYFSVNVDVPLRYKTEGVSEYVWIYANKRELI